MLIVSNQLIEIINNFKINNIKIPKFNIKNKKYLINLFYGTKKNNSNNSSQVNSSRLKNKILNKIENQELIFFLISRVLKVKNIDDLIVVIPKNKKIIT